MSDFDQRRGRFLVSCNPALLDHAAINEFFGTTEMSWCSPLDEEAMKVCLSNSLCLGVYLEATTDPLPDSTTAPRPTQIGLARMITDRCTIVYLTDVYIKPEYRHEGLGSWLIDCVHGFLRSMPNLRKALLVADTPNGEIYYGKKLGTERLEQGKGGHYTLVKYGPAFQGRDEEQ
jgi:GNAT superfamily N-acetyltransferase